MRGSRVAVGVRILRVDRACQRANDLVGKVVQFLIAFLKGFRLAVDFVVQRVLQMLEVENAANPLHRHLRHKRLADKIHRALFEELGFGVCIRVGGQEHHRQIFAGLDVANPVQDFDPAHDFHESMTRFALIVTWIQN